MALHVFMSLDSPFDSVVTDFCVHILQNRDSACRSCVYLQVSKGCCCRLVFIRKTGCFNKLRAMGDGTASVLPHARVGRVRRAQQDLCLSLCGCAGIVGSPLCCVELNSGASWC